MSKDALFSCFSAKSPTKGVFIFCLVALICVSGGLVSQNLAAEYQTPNFIIRNAPNADLARQFGETAEKCRKDLAYLWLGEELPRWAAPCHITVKVGDLGAGGETSMQFENGHVFGWDMHIQGSADAIITAVLPHEITHMILASHFREPLPRWADEGAATFVENEKERQNYRRLLYQYLRTGRGIAFNQMFRMAKYPDDQMPLYAQGFSLAEFLIMQQGHRHYVRFVGAGMQSQNWAQSICDHYGYENLGELQVKWNRWVDAGCPNLQQLDPNQPILVRESTQYIASRDFWPINQPMILAHNEQTPVMLASLETPVPAQVAPMPQEPEPLRLAIQQQSHDHQLNNRMLAASLTPISESRQPMQMINSNSVVNRPHDRQLQPQVTQGNRVPAAIAAQPLDKYQHVNPAAQETVRKTPYFSPSPNVSQESTKPVEPCRVLENNVTATPQNSYTQTGDSRVIFDWRIR